MGKLVYRRDKHLDFLNKVDNDKLGILVKIITEDKDGNIRDSEDLTLQNEYKKYHPNHQRYWRLIVADYQYFGGNTFVSMFRGKGVLYEEMLNDTCSDMKVNLPKNASIETKERNLLLKIIERSLEEMSDKEKEEFLKSLDLKSTNLTTPVIMATLQSAILVGGFYSYQLAVIVANSIAKALLGQGLLFATNTAITRGLAVFAGPIAISLAGPAKRVTIPATIYIASLRQAEFYSERKPKKKVSNS
jgi:uncharacterized protein YaaW (UPF0174 family)